MKQYAGVLLKALKSEDSPLDVLAAFIAAWSAVTKGNMLAIHIRRKLEIKEMKDIRQTLYLFLSRIKTDPSFKNKAVDALLMSIDRNWFREFLIDIARMGATVELKRAIERLKSFGSSPNLGMLLNDLKMIEESQNIKTIPFKSQFTQQIPLRTHIQVHIKPDIQTSTPKSQIPPTHQHPLPKPTRLEKHEFPSEIYPTLKPAPPEIDHLRELLTRPSHSDLAETERTQEGHPITMQSSESIKLEEVIFDETTSIEDLFVPETRGVNDLKGLLGELENLHVPEETIDESKEEVKAKTPVKDEIKPRVEEKKSSTPEAPFKTEVVKSKSPLKMLKEAKPIETKLVTEEKKPPVTKVEKVSIEVLADLQAHKARITMIRWSPIGNFFASASYDKTVIIWDAQNNKKYAQLKGHRGRVVSIAWRKDGKLLASGDEFGKIILWSFEKKKKLKVLEEHKNIVNALAWSYDGKRLYSGGRDRKVIVWNLEGEPKEEKKFEFDEEVSAIDATSDILVVAHSVVIEFIDPLTLVSRYSFTVEKPVKCIKISPDERLIAVGSKGGMLTIYDRIKGIKKSVKEHGSDISSIAWSADCKYLLTTGMDSKVILWDIETLKPLKVERMKDWITAGDWNSKENKAVLGLWNKRILIIEVKIE